MARRCKCGCSTELPPASKCSDIIEKKGYSSVECLTSHTREKLRIKLQKEQKKRNAEFKRKVKENDLKTRKDAAKRACHKYIRERDKGKPCICCGRPLGVKYDAGHFLESGNNPKIRYHEDNIHAQSVYCNQYKGGNSDDYEGRLRLKIGNDRVDYLLSNKGGTVKRTCDDYREIEQYYKDKLEALLK